MSFSGAFPITVLMRRRPLQSRWLDHAWCAEAVLPGWVLQAWTDEERHAVQGLELALHDDEAEGYLENWAAPEPKVFVSWRMVDERAMPVQASVSYAEGTRMFDSGDPADGLPMPAAIHTWLGQWLQLNYRAPERKGRARHGI
jgi:hypothetical protein